MLAYMFSAFLSGNVNMFFYSLSTKRMRYYDGQLCDCWMKKNLDEEIEDEDVQSCFSEPVRFDRDT